jgi:hypothetical protein
LFGAGVRAAVCVYVDVDVQIVTQRTKF